MIEVKHFSIVVIDFIIYTKIGCVFVTIDRIETLAKEKGMSLSFLCGKLGLARNYLSEVKKGKTKISDDRLAIIADILNTSPEYLKGETDIKEKPLPSFGSPVGEIVVFPVAVAVKAGFGSEAIKIYGDEVTEIPRSMLRGYSPSECIVALVNGNSMYPRICEGDKVLVHLQSSVDSGDVAMVIYDGEEATIKKVRYVTGENWVELIPANPEYMTLRIDGAGLEKCHIIGRVIKSIRDF